MKTIAIIGGGAAGLMAAAHLAESAKDKNITIHLFDKNDHLGAKVIISGGGRCNVTTGIHDIKQLLENYPRGAKFLMSAMYKLPPPKVMEWFESHGIPLKTEEDLRVFPKSDNGKDIVSALEKTITQNPNVTIHLHLKTNVTNITKKTGFIITTIAKHPLREKETITADYLVIATGGNTYRQTGSTGDGYAFAQSLGHTITKLAPSLSSFMTKEDYPKDLAGVSFTQTEITLDSNSEKKSYTRKGPLVFTHRGISGPAIFAISGMAAYENFSTKEPHHLTINFLPHLTKTELLEKLQKEANLHGKKEFKNFLDIFLPKSLCEVIARELMKRKKLSSSIIHAGQMNAELKKETAELIHAFPFTITDRSPGEEFVTAGGVPLTEVDTNTMESKICQNLFFGGEVLDIDGFTGGFNLQASWATGYLAGESILKKV